MSAMSRKSARSSPKSAKRLFFTALVVGHHHDVVEKAVHRVAEISELVQRLGVAATLDHRQHLLPGVSERIEERVLGVLCHSFFLTVRPSGSPACLQDVGDALVGRRQALGLFEPGKGLHGGEPPVEVDQ